jgi:hypothetical protein
MRPITASPGPRAEAAEACPPKRGQRAPDRAALFISVGDGVPPGPCVHRINLDRLRAHSENFGPSSQHPDPGATSLSPPLSEIRDKLGFKTLGYPLAELRGQLPVNASI